MVNFKEILFKILNFKQINKGKNENFNSWINLEIIWTIIPSIILILIAIPSFSILYSIEDLPDNYSMIVKVIGHQWYWSYEIPDYLINNDEYIELVNKEKLDKELQYNSFLIPFDKIYNKYLRILETDTSLIIPKGTFIKILVTSSDVLHSWAIPSLGVKIDAVPGRLNQTIIHIKENGIYYGQCSEICGINHGFMPINVIAIDKNKYSLFYEKYFRNFFN
jgi:cytochrome c oxidase subunit II